MTETGTFSKDLRSIRTQETIELNHKKRRSSGLRCLYGVIKQIREFGCHVTKEKTCQSSEHLRHKPRRETGLVGQEMGHTGLEPVTSCVSYKRASQLRQWPHQNMLL